MPFCVAAFRRRWEYPGMGLVDHYFGPWLPVVRWMGLIDSVGAALRLGLVCLEYRRLRPQSSAG